MASMVRSDALHCERVARRHARTLSLAAYFLPARKRRATFAVYSFCRATRDSARSRKLQTHRRDLAEALDGRPRGPVFRELRWAAREFEVPTTALFDFVDGLASDARAGFDTWDDLLRRCDDTARPAGIMYGAVFGIPGTPRQQELARTHARTLGAAIQLTRILRDAGDEARQGRCWLPAEELDRFSLSETDILENPEFARDKRWHRLMTFEIERARSLYRQALPGIKMLEDDSQRCAAACVIGYAAILDALEQIRYDSVSSHASIGAVARLGVMWNAWRFRGQLRAG
jgi:phytoene synthase